MILIEFLEQYFSDLNESFSLDVDLKKAYMFNTNFADIETKYRENIGKQTSNMKFDFDSCNENFKDTFVSAVLNTSIFFYNFLQNPDNEELIKESLLRLLQNFEEYMSLQPYFDESCYIFFKGIFEKAMKRNLVELGQLINKHNQYFEEEFPIQKKVEHLTIVTKVQEYYKNLWDKLSLQEAFDLSNFNFIQKLLVSSKEEQHKCFDDWFLKFAQVIEKYYKMCLFTLCRVNNLAEHRLSTKYNTLAKSSIKFASVLWNIDKKYYTYPNVNRIRIMRNGIDHGNVKFQMNGEWQTYQFLFADQKNQAKRTVMEFIFDYFKVIKFVFTFDLVCKFYELKVAHPHQSISEILVEGFEDFLPKYLEELRKSPKLDYVDLKNLGKDQEENIKKNEF